MSLASLEVTLKIYSNSTMVTSTKLKTFIMAIADGRACAILVFSPWVVGFGRPCIRHQTRLKIDLLQVAYICACRSSAKGLFVKVV